MSERSAVPQLMTVGKASEYFGLTKNFLRTGIKTGQIAAIKTGRVWYIKVSDLQTQIDNGVTFHT